MDVVVIAAFAALLALVPARVDRWALRRGATPQTLAALAAVTLLGVVAVPVTFAICTGILAAHEGGRDGLSFVAVAGLLLVAVGAGRTIARMMRVRRQWAALSRLAAALELPEVAGGARVLPVSELLAFASGSDAFISRGLIDRLTPEQRRAVIAHEREHVAARHGRLLGLARAIAHGTFELAPARQAAGALDRELDALADQAAAHQVGDPLAVRDAVQAVASVTGGDRSIDDATRERIERLAGNGGGRRPAVDAVVRLVTLILAALVVASVCVSLHAGSAWLGVAACALLVAGFLSLTRSVLKRPRPVLGSQEVPDA